MIVEIREGAQGVFSLAGEGAWERARRRTGILRESTARLEASQRRQLPGLERAIADLSWALDSQDAPRSRRLAIEVMRQTARFSLDYAGSESAAICTLELEACELLVDLDEDPIAADAAVARIAKLWMELRPEAEKRGGHALASRCDGHVQALDSGGTTTRRSEALALLETLERLEDLFS
jgi:hypothetical protein